MGETIVYFRLKGRKMKAIYLVLGASSETGIAFISRLDRQAVEGTEVVAHYSKSSEKLLELQRELKNIRLILIGADLSKKEEVEEFVLELERKQICPTHILHLAAKPLCYQKLKNWDDALMEEEMQIQVYAFARICSNILPMMSKNHFGRVAVAASSVTIGLPPAYMSHYVAVKYALLGLVRAMAAEYGSKGICVNAVSPSMMETKFLDQIDDKIIQLSSQNSLRKSNITVEETVEGIMYLLSEGASALNGTNLNLTGGTIM